MGNVQRMTGGYSIVRELFCPRAGGTYFCPRCAGTQHLRVSVALAYIFLGAFGVLLKKHKVVAPGKYLLIFVGVCFANFSILPSVTSLYFLKGIDIRLLDEDTLKSLNDHAGIQSEFLKNIAILFGIYGFGFLILVSRLFRRKGTT
jgi:hypothetical protein